MNVEVLVTPNVPPIVALLVTASPTPAPVRLTLPCKVVLTPALPIVSALAFVVPNNNVPVVPVAVPESIEMFPLLLVEPKASPLCTDIALLFTLAELVLLLETFADTADLSA